MIAIGHSGLTGEGTAGESEPAYDNSWATGTSSDVNSIYLRLTVARPEFQGHVANTAQGGAKSSALIAQATSALAQVPVPAFVIISTIDNDIQCDGNDLGRIPQLKVELGQNVFAEPLDIAILHMTPVRPEMRCDPMRARLLTNPRDRDRIWFRILRVRHRRIARLP
jgi:hypothetical protein